MNDVAHRLLGTAEAASTRGSRPRLGLGEEALAAAYSKGGRRPETGLERSPLVRRERAHTYGCWPTLEYTTCPKTSIGSALGLM